jgi:hypothetical protein
MENIINSNELFDMKHMITKAMRLKEIMNADFRVWYENNTEENSNKLSESASSLTAILDKGHEKFESKLSSQPKDKPIIEHLYEEMKQYEFRHDLTR